ncbi:MAG: phospholipase D-like domain-containing protein [Spirochaetia bacterium]|nr:phospholipase D-like domain-containing protein [Spirochaetia bacterium]
MKMQRSIYLFIFIINCAYPPFGDPGDAVKKDLIQVFYNDPGKNELNTIDKKIDIKLIELINKAEKSIYIAAYQLNRENIIDSLIKARNRGVDVKFVGDIDEFESAGYQELYKNNIDMTVGNSSGIQHNKFIIIDNQYLFTGTGNFTDNGFLRNNNNFILIKNKEVVEYYLAEFNQMYKGLFGKDKKPHGLNNIFDINENKVEVYFSPYMGNEAIKKLTELVDNAKHSVHYMIFSFTDNELSSALIRAARQKDMDVYGIHDFNFITKNSEEAPRLFAAKYNNDMTMHQKGPHIFLDGSIYPEDMGGKMHCKTIIIDAGTDNAILATGSFNWSKNAVENNDENLIIIHDPKTANRIYNQFNEALKYARSMSSLMPNIYGNVLNNQDIVISEIGWAGSSNFEIDNSDDFIELYNRSAKIIDLSYFSLEIGGTQKKIVSIPSEYNWYYETENLIHPGEYKIIYTKNDSAFTKNTYEKKTYPHILLSGVKEFSLQRSDFNIKLYDKAMNLIDQAGNSLETPAGYFNTTNTFSMNRYGYDNEFILNGALKSAWYHSSLNMNCSFMVNPDNKCEEFSAYTYASAGYSNEPIQEISIIDAELIDAKNILLHLNANMINCEGADKFIINTCDNTSLQNASLTEAPSEILLSFENDCFSLPSAIYEISPSVNCKDTNLLSAGGTFFINGINPSASNKEAELILNEVAMKESNDWIELKAVKSGLLKGYRIFEYNESSKELLYEFNEKYISEGDFIVILLKNSYSQHLLSEDKSGDCNADGIPACYVYSTAGNLSGTDSVILLEYKEEVADMVYYSDYDGTISSGMMKGALLYTHENLQHVWPFSEKPLDEYNDEKIQKEAVDISLANSAGKGIVRQSAGLKDWVFTDVLTVGY